jgi:hypothetical protein
MARERRAATISVAPARITNHLADYSFIELGRATPGIELDILEEAMIRRFGALVARAASCLKISITG